MIPETIRVDSTLPEAGQIRYALEDHAQDALGDGAVVDRLHRIFYPVFRVSYTYATAGSAGVGRETTLLDGLWTDNHAPLQQYRSAAESPTGIALSGYDFGRDRAGLGRSVLLDFQVSDRQAAQLLPERLEDARVATEAGDATGFTDRLHETFTLPATVDAESFEDVVDVTPLYLPFWLAAVTGPGEQGQAIGVVRSVDDVTERSPHGWLADALQEDMAHLGQYAHTAIQQTIDGPSRHHQADNESTAGGPESETAEAAETAPNEPVQPDSADLDACQLVEPSPDRCFGDVGGMTELESTLRRSVIGPVEQPDRFREYGLDPVSGVIFYGPPGCGKTHVAGALAGELDYAFLDVTPADLSSKYVGKPAENVQDVFAIAKANQPCVLFLDEIDAIASAREDRSSTSERGMVNQLLGELEDIDDEAVLVLAATNLLDDVDDAILRTGRFDERIEVPPPDTPARREILEIHLEGRPLAEDCAIDPIVEATAGYAASDLEHIAADAARRALRDGSPIETDDLRAAVDATESSVPDWGDSAVGDGKTVVQPDGVDLRARSLVTTETGRTFDDVGGMDELKSRLHETVVDPLENADRYAEYGLDVTSGVLLYGPPGCGKTHVAGALAGELDVAFLEVTPADLTSKWMGEPAQNVADLFEIARQNEPCVLFLDEIDGVAGSRGGSGSTNQRQLVNQLLTELETLDDHDVVVVGATNLLDDVDDAILRSGRFDERVEVPPPDATAREEILQLALADRPIADEISWSDTATYTEGYAASDLTLLADNAARKAMQASDIVRERYLLEAVSETRSSLEGWSSDGNGPRHWHK